MMFEWVVPTGRVPPETLPSEWSIGHVASAHAGRKGWGGVAKP